MSHIIHALLEGGREGGVSMLAAVCCSWSCRGEGEKGAHGSCFKH
jgi:hypothetical protein